MQYFLAQQLIFWLPSLSDAKQAGTDKFWLCRSLDAVCVGAGSEPANVWRHPHGKLSLLTVDCLL